MAVKAVKEWSIIRLYVNTHLWHMNNSCVCFLSSKAWHSVGAVSYTLVRMFLFSEIFTILSHPRRFSHFNAKPWFDWHGSRKIYFRSITLCDILSCFPWLHAEPRHWRCVCVLMEAWIYIFFWLHIPNLCFIVCFNCSTDRSAEWRLTNTRPTNYNQL